MLKLTPPLLTVAFWSVHRLIATNRCVFAVPLARVQSTSTLGVSFAPPKPRGGVAFVLPPPCVSSACLGVGFVLVVFVVMPWHEVYMLGTGVAMLAAGESANSYALKRPEAHEAPSRSPSRTLFIAAQYLATSLALATLRFGCRPLVEALPAGLSFGLGFRIECQGLHKLVASWKPARTALPRSFRKY